MVGLELEDLSEIRYGRRYVTAHKFINIALFKQVPPSFAVFTRPLPKLACIELSIRNSRRLSPTKILSNGPTWSKFGMPTQRTPPILTKNQLQVRSFYFVLNLSPAHRIIHSGTTLADVKRELNKEEDEEMKNGVLPLHQVSSVQFLTTGLEIEEQQ